MLKNLFNDDALLKICIGLYMLQGVQGLLSADDDICKGRKAASASFFGTNTCKEVGADCITALATAYSEADENAKPAFSPDQLIQTCGSSLDSSVFQLDEFPSGVIHSVETFAAYLKCPQASSAKVKADLMNLTADQIIAGRGLVPMSAYPSEVLAKLSLEQLLEYVESKGDAPKGAKGYFNGDKYVSSLDNFSTLPVLNSDENKVAFMRMFLSRMARRKATRNDLPDFPVEFFKAIMEDENWNVDLEKLVDAQVAVYPTEISNACNMTCDEWKAKDDPIDLLYTLRSKKSKILDSKGNVKDCFAEGLYEDVSFAKKLQSLLGWEKLGHLPRKFFKTAFHHIEPDVDAEFVNSLSGNAKSYFQNRLDKSEVITLKHRYRDQEDDTVANAITKHELAISILEEKAKVPSFDSNSISDELATMKAKLDELKQLKADIDAATVPATGEEVAIANAEVKREEAIVAFWKKYKGDDYKEETWGNGLKIAKAHKAYADVNAELGEPQETSEYYLKKISVVKALVAWKKAKGETVVDEEAEIKRLEAASKPESERTPLEKGIIAKAELEELEAEMTELQKNPEENAEAIKALQKKIDEKKGIVSSTKIEEAKNIVAALDENATAVDKAKANLTLAQAKLEKSDSKANKLAVKEAELALEKAKKDALVATDENADTSALDSEIETLETAIKDLKNAKEDEIKTDWVAKLADKKASEVTDVLKQLQKQSEDLSEEVNVLLDKMIADETAVVEAAHTEYMKKTSDAEKLTALENAIKVLASVYNAKAGCNIERIRALPGFALKHMEAEQIEIVKHADNLISSVEDFIDKFAYGKVKDPQSDKTPFMHTLFHSCAYFLDDLAKTHKGSSYLVESREFIFKEDSRKEIVKAVKKHCVKNSSSSLMVQFTVAISAAFVALLL